MRAPRPLVGSVFTTWEVDGMHAKRHKIQITVVATPTCLAAAGASAGTFPDFGYQPPASYTGPLFQLSQNYPQHLPTAMPAFFKQLPAKFSDDFETWRPYVDAVKHYCLEGNVETDWDVQKNPVRHWYHM